MKVAININENVKIKLLERGLKELERQHEELRKLSPSIGPWRPPAVDEDGYSKMQLWNLMQDLGHLCSMGFEPPFETEIIFEVRP
jgi:repressor LexA